MSENHRLSRLRAFVLAMTIVVVFFAIATPIVVVAFLQRQAATTQLSVTCTILRANIRELAALEAVRREIGLPRSIRVPEVPAECKGVGE